MRHARLHAKKAPLMDQILRCFVAFGVLMLAPLALLYAADPLQPATERNAAPETDKGVPRPNLLIIGASSLNSPVELTQLVGAMLTSEQIPMNIEGSGPKLDDVGEMLRSQKKWDFIVMDAWHLGRTRKDWGTGNATVPAEFPKAVAAFVKEVRDHSPECKIILFPWWIPSGRKATNEGAMEVFNSCVEQAKVNEIWVATTGPAFMEARLERTDLKITKSTTDAHPGIHGAYLNACSLFAIIADKSPVGLPATLKIGAGGKRDYAIAADDAKYLQEVAWKIYQREIKNTKPVQ
jgi:hypothetical protein